MVAACRLLRELALILGAVVAALFVVRVLPRAPAPAMDRVPRVGAGLSLPNPARVPTAFTNAVLSRRLRDGDAVLFGSSELAFDGVVAPHRFFPHACGRRILTIGRAGYQSLPIALTLASVKDALSPRSDVSIILSPGWFAEFGTPSGAFLRYLAPEALRTLFAKDDLPLALRAAVARQIRIHRDEFSGLYPDWLLPTWSGLAEILPVSMGERYVVPRRPVPPAENFDWDAAERTQRERTVAEAAGNPLGVEMSYYARTKATLPKAVAPLDRFGVERRDLYALSDLLKSSGVKARFIVQPLHRRVYRDLAAYDRRVDEATAQLRRDGHRVVEFAREPFDLQLLRDSVHFSGYGWVKVQRAMCER